MQMGLKMVGAALAGIALAAAAIGAFEKYHFVPDKSADYVEVSCSSDGYKIEGPKLTLNQYMGGGKPSNSILPGETAELTGHHFASDGNGGTYEDESYGGVGTKICSNFILTAAHVVHEGFSYTAGGSAEVLDVYELDPSKDLALLRINNPLPSDETGKTRIRTSTMKEDEPVVGVAIDPNSGVAVPFTRLYKKEGGQTYRVENKLYNQDGKSVDTYERRQYHEALKNPDGTFSTGNVIEKNPATEPGWSGTSFYDMHGNLTGVLVSADLSTGFTFARSGSGVEMYETGRDYAVRNNAIVDFLKE